MGPFRGIVRELSAEIAGKHEIAVGRLVKSKIVFLIII
jgi:hypothetical protein